MATYCDVHPVDPQPRIIAQVARALADDAVIVYPTDSGYALGARMGAHDAVERIRHIRNVDERHHFTLVCANFAQLGHFVRVANSQFRAIKAATPGPYTFILPATPEVPRQLAHPRKKTVGVRIPQDAVAQAILREHGEPILSSSLLLPGHDTMLTEGWQIKEELDHLVDLVVDGGERGAEPTTVVDYSQGPAQILRIGSGDPTRFE